MKRNLLLQTKREFKMFPFVLAVTLALFMGLGLILSGVIKNLSSDEENQRFKIALTGDMDNKYIDTGLTVIRTLDDTRFSMEIVEMEEDAAKKALAKGEISAYVILPEDFMEKILVGENESVKYITSPGGGGVVTLFKNEITQLITDIVVYSQKGTYGIEDAVRSVGLNRKAGKYIYKISLAYVDLVFNRSEAYEVNELGITGGATMVESMACGILVLLLMLIGLPYVVVHTKKNRDYSRLLLSRGHNVISQVGSEFFAHFLAMLLLTASVMGIATIAVKMIGFVDIDEFVALLEVLLPVVFLFSAFNMMVFEMADDIVSGVLLHFFVSVSMCYISGCMYPITAFPKMVQKLVAFTPTGMARDWLTACFTDETPILSVVGVMVYALIFLGVTFIVRIHKIKHTRG